MQDILTMLTSGVYIAGVVVAAMDNSGDDVLIASAEERMTVLTNGVLVKDLTEEVASKLVRSGMDIRTVDGLSHVTTNLECAARSRSTAKKVKADKPEVKKRVSAQDKRAEQLKQNALTHLTSPQAAAMVRRLWIQNVEAAEDYKFFPMFYKEIDALIAEYRIHTGVDKQPPLDIDPDSEDEADDYDAEAIIGSLDQTELPLANPPVKTDDTAVGEASVPAEEKVLESAA